MLSNDSSYSHSSDVASWDAGLLWIFVDSIVAIRYLIARCLLCSKMLRRKPNVGAAGHGPVLGLLSVVSSDGWVAADAVDTDPVAIIQLRESMM